MEGRSYVIKTLEAILYCLLQTTNYKDAVLKAVNLGRDTDTVAAITVDRQESIMDNIIFHRMDSMYSSNGLYLPVM